MKYVLTLILAFSLTSLRAQTVQVIQLTPEETHQAEQDAVAAKITALRAASWAEPGPNVKHKVASK